MKTAYLLKVLGEGGGLPDAPLTLIAHAARRRRREPTRTAVQNLNAPFLVAGALLKA